MNTLSKVPETLAGLAVFVQLLEKQRHLIEFTRQPFGKGINERLKTFFETLICSHISFHNYNEHKYHILSPTVLQGESQLSRIERKMQEPKKQEVAVKAITGSRTTAVNGFKNNELVIKV